ncbi:hypothetical protein NC652_009742 [Populus alba x Populus x berolinensis]|nr:hypothetical protein NC652_009742 [Populus alba x Populus x berolinensis]
MPQHCPVLSTVLWPVCFLASSSSLNTRNKTELSELVSYRWTYQTILIMFATFCQTNKEKVRPNGLMIL